MAPLQNEDLFLVQRGTDIYNSQATDIKDYTNDGLTTDVVIDGQTFKFVNGLLISIT